MTTPEGEWAAIDAAYAQLRTSPADWAEYRAELDGWEEFAGEADPDAVWEWPEYQNRDA